MNNNKFRSNFTVTSDYHHMQMLTANQVISQLLVIIIKFKC